MTKGELISYAIGKECRRDSLVRWCESWGITIEEFAEFLYLGGQSFDKRDEDDRNCFTCIHLNGEKCDMQKCEYKERTTEPSQIARDIATILETEKFKWCKEHCHPGPACPDGFCKEVNEVFEERTQTHSCDCGKKETHGDVIYRADAMRILDEAWVDDTEYNGDSHTAFEELPSAEKQEKVIYSTMPDEDFEEWLRAHGICHPDIHEPIPCSVVPLLIDDAINELPSAESKRKTGKWIRHPEQANIYGGKCVECSECGEKYVVSYIEDEKFCRNCGAKMEAGK